MEIILEKVISWAVPALLTGLVSILSWIGLKLNTYLKEIKNDIKETKQITIENDILVFWSLLHKTTEEVRTTGICTLETMSLIDSVFEKYDSLNGNHGMKARVESCRLIYNNIQKR